MSIAHKPFEMSRDCYEQIKFISPNLYELRRIADTLGAAPSTQSDLRVENVSSENEKRRLFDEIIELCGNLQAHIDNIIVTAGSFGVFIQRRRAAEDAFLTKDMTYVVEKGGVKSCRHYLGQPLETIVNASGAGDAFCSGFIAGMLRQKSESICVSIGLQAAISTLMSKRAVPKRFFGSEHRCWTTPAEFEDMRHFWIANMYQILKLLKHVPLPDFHLRKSREKFLQRLCKIGGGS